MLDRIEHVALAVEDLDSAIADLARLWDLEVADRERIDDQGVEEATLDVGRSRIQLVAPTSATSTVARFLERRGEGLHHIAYEVADLEETLRDLKARGARLVDERPRRGGGGHLVAFVHPQSSCGVLVELVQRGAPPDIAGP
ncbi:methylmalonyl-CoA epimerase [soil metagenome]